MEMPLEFILVGMITWLRVVLCEKCKCSDLDSDCITWRKRQTAQSICS